MTALPFDAQESWPVVPIKVLFARVRRRARPEDGVVTAFRDGQVALRSGRRTEGFTNAIQEHGYQGVRVGDLVVHSMDGFAGAIGVSQDDGKISPVAHCYRPRPGVNPWYYAYLLRHLATSGFIASLAKGIRERSTSFDAETFRALRVPVPPPGIQEAIVRHLDTEVGGVIEIERERHQVLGLLSGRFRSLSDRVVRGLQDGDEPDPRWADVGPLGIRWPGPSPSASVPSVPFWSLAKRVSCPSRGGEQLLSVYLEHGVIPHSAEGIQVHAPSTDLSTYQVVRPGDLVMNNQQAWRGSVGVTSLSGIVSPAYHVFRVSPRLHSRYANHLFRSPMMVGQYEQVSRGVGSIQRQLSPSELRVVRVPLPGWNAQVKSAELLDEAVAALDGARKPILQQLDLLRERRETLITAAVTGELDIPGVAA